MGQSFLGVEDRSKARFKINDAIVLQILRLLVSHALQRFCGLHYGDGVGEAFQVSRQAARVGALKKPVRQRLRIGSGQLGVFRVSRQLDDGRGRKTPSRCSWSSTLGKARSAFSSKLPRFVLMNFSHTSLRPAIVREIVAPGLALAFLVYAISAGRPGQAPALHSARAMALAARAPAARRIWRRQWERFAELDPPES